MPDRSGWDRRPGFALSGKRALVLGADSAVGEQAARALAEAGASVRVVAALGPASGVSGLAAAIGGTADAWDARSPGAIADGMARAATDGAPTVLVTALNHVEMGPIETLSDARYRDVMAVNLDAVYLACRAFLAALPADAANARIICYTTMFGERGIDNLAAYSAAQGGVHNLVRALAQEIGARNGATANAIATGWMTDTPGRGPDELGRNRLMRFVPMRRFGEAAEAAPLAVLLASDASGYLSGQVFHIDGGVTQHL